MQSKHLLLSSLFLLLCAFSFAQRNTPRPKCASVLNLDAILRDPVKAKAYYKNKALIARRINEMRSGASITAVGDTIQVPVVFHIIDPNPDAITNDMVNLQLMVLNRDYSGKNPDSANANLFYGIRGHAAIKFVLAKRSPRGCDTIGITRTVSALQVHTDIYDNQDVLISPSTIDQIKHTATGGIDGWESYNCKYINIWVGTLTNGLLGQATFPDTDVPPVEQGVVIDKETFSFTPGSYTFGRTLVHEMGHYLNLKHIWGDDQDRANTCSGSDDIDDTPNQSVSSSGAPVGKQNDICSPAPGNGINYQNYMDYCDDVALTMFTKRQVEMVFAAISVLANRSYLIDKNNKALEPKESNELFTMCNTAEFTTNAFTTIAVGKGGVVWAGTANSGLYNYWGGRWRRMNAYINNNYQDIKADKYGGIWIGQSGYSGAQANTGGVLYFSDSIFPATNNYYSFSNGLPSRYIKGLFIDTTKTFTSGLDTPMIFTANFAHITAGVSAAGGVGRGFNPVPPNYFSTTRKGIQPARVTDGTASVYSIAGDYKVIWAHIQNNYGVSQILRYKNDVLMDTLPSLDNSNILSILTPNFNAKAMYFDARGNRWIAVNGKGIIVTDSTETVWHTVDFASLFPATPGFNNNAISGDTSGNVFIGTTNGLIVYRTGKTLDDAQSYTLYTTANGLPSNNIKAIAADTMRKKLLIATDNGIIFWNPVCADGPAIDNSSFSTVATGDWNNPAIWCNGVVPPPNAKIIVRHPVTITVDAQCKSLQLVLPGSFTVATGINFTVGN